MEIIPAIDILDGRCVRLKKGNFSEKTIYHNDPVEMAILLHDQGLNRLHLVDLDGAKAGKVINHGLLEKIFFKTGMIIDFGGGIKTDMDVEIALQAGAEMITAGSIAVKDRTSIIRWINKFGREKIILGADVNKGYIAIDAWLTDSHREVIGFIDDYIKAGIQKIICTDISRDGMMNGPAMDLYRQIRNQFKDIHLIASGGVSALSDLDELEHLGVNGVIIGKALYEGTIMIKDLQKYIR
jgi:phosphoribosylformimino-5-aminoimidazole carboxamide ribotide isomerase